MPSDIEMKKKEMNNEEERLRDTLSARQDAGAVWQDLQGHCFFLEILPSSLAFYFLAQCVLDLTPQILENLQQIV